MVSGNFEPVVSGKASASMDAISEGTPKRTKGSPTQCFFRPRRTRAYIPPTRPDELNRPVAVARIDVGYISCRRKGNYKSFS